MAENDTLTKFKANPTVELAKALAGEAQKGSAEVKYQMIKDGVLKPCNELLKSKDENMQKLGAHLLHCLAFGNDKARASIGQEGAIPHLVAMLSSDSKTVKNQAALTLASLVKGVNKNKVALMKAEGVPPLLKIFNANADAKLVENVTSVMRNLATNGSIAAAVAPIIPKLVTIIKDSSTPGPQLAETIHLLTNIASHEELREQLVDGGIVDAARPIINSPAPDNASASIQLFMHLSHSEKIVPKLENIIDPVVAAWKAATESKVKSDATDCLKNLSKFDKFRFMITSKDAGKALVSTATPGSPKVSPHTPKIEKLVKQLLDAIESSQAVDAAKQLAELAQSGPDVKEEILRAGVFAELWKTAKQGKLGWADKWYSTIDEKKLTFKEELGTGAFATVYKGVYKNPQTKKKEDVAIKAMDETLVNLPDLRCELATLSMLSGLVEHMVEFKGYFYLVQQSKGPIKTTKKYHCIVMELMQTSLEHIIHEEKKKLSEQQLRYIALDMATGMDRVQSFDVIHRDLKPANILMSQAKGNGDRLYSVRIADFGYARRDTNDSIRKSVVGTPAYLAPELIGQTKSWDVTKLTDVYSYGVILWEMVTLKKPHEGLEVNSLYQQVHDARKANKPVLPVPSTGDPILREIMSRALLPDPAHRPTFADIKLLLTQNLK